MTEKIKFIIIDPRQREVRTVSHHTLVDAQLEAGLKPREVDHGTLGRGWGYCCYEYALFVPAAQQAYFAIGRSLFAGPIVVYGYDELGEMMDCQPLPDQPAVRWVDDPEAAMRRGEIERPCTRFNGIVDWQWSAEGREP